MSSSPPPVPPALPYAAAEPEDRKPPVLAWWGIIPSLVFIGIQVVLGCMEAKRRAAPPEYAVGYITGGVLTGLLISFVIAWVVYRVSSRSRLAATVTYTIFVCFFCLAVASKAARDRQTNLGGSAPAGLAQPASFGAFDFDVPVGWRRVQGDAGKTKALIALPNAASPKTTGGILKVDVGRPAHSSAREMAETFTAGGGRVLPGRVLIDGVEGLRVETTSTDLSRPRHIVVVFKDGQAYLIMGAAADGLDVSGAFDQVLRSWRWNDVE